MISLGDSTTAAGIVSKHYPRKGTETAREIHVHSLGFIPPVSKHYPRKGTETL